MKIFLPAYVHHTYKMKRIRYTLPTGRDACAYRVNAQQLTKLLTTSDYGRTEIQSTSLYVAHDRSLRLRCS